MSNFLNQLVELAHCLSGIADDPGKSGRIAEILALLVAFAAVIRF